MCEIHADVAEGIISCPINGREGERLMELQVREGKPAIDIRVRSELVIHANRELVRS